LAARKRKAAGGGSEDLVLVAGDKPQMRQCTARSWNANKEKVFLTVLAETCNVTRACEAAGVGVTSAYRRKKEHAAFRAAWLAAVSMAYQQLELVLLERAFVGTEKTVSVRGGEPKVMREYSDRLGLSLLKMHRDTATDAEFELPADEVEEVRARLIRKLQRMKQRDGD
jgi:hypothetical protein